MGCAGSKIQDEEAVHRCKQRKCFVKQAVSARTNFATAHVNYLQALRNTGAAFKQFADAEFKDQQQQLPDTPRTPLSIPKTPPPPPPPEINLGMDDCSIPQPMTPPPSHPRPMASPSPNETLARSVSLPSMPLKNTPSSPITVVLSPPKSPVHKEDGDFMYADMSSSQLLYNEFMPPPPPPTLSHGSPPLPSQPSGLDYFEIFQFQAPQMPMHRKYKPMYDLDEDELEGEEEVPALEEDVVKLPKKEQRRTEEVPSMILEPKEPHMNVEVFVSEDKGGQKHQEYVENTKAVESGPEKLKLHSQDSFGNEIELEETSEDDDSTESDPMEGSNLSRPIEGATSNGEQSDHVEEQQNLEKVILVPRGPPRDLFDILREVDEYFLKASDSGRDVSRMLEAGKSNVNETKDHSSRLLSALSLGTWSPRWSPRTPLSFRDDEDFECGGMMGSHASTLDRLSAWEKKLYEEVKALETVNFEFDRKRKLLRNQDARGVDEELKDKTRASIKALETQMQVAIQAMESTSTAIQKMTDEEVQPQLMELLEGLAKMWKEMSECHEQQRNIVLALKLPIDHMSEATSSLRRNVTGELISALNTWQTTFFNVINTQREYMRNLNSWLQLCVWKPDNSKRSKVPNPQQIHELCRQWDQDFSKISDKAVSEAIRKFTEIVHDIAKHQAEEQRAQKKVESVAKDLNRRITADRKYVEQIDNKLDFFETSAGISPSSDRRASIDTLRKRVEEEREKSVKVSEETWSLTLKSFQDGLPNLFHTISEFSAEYKRTYGRLCENAKQGTLVNASTK